MTNLLACPFCGGKAVREDIEARDGVENAGASYITCVDCWAATSLHFGRKENLVSSWNRRSGVVAWRPIEEASRDKDYLLGWWYTYPGKTERLWQMEVGWAGSSKGGWWHGQATHFAEAPIGPREDEG